MSELRRTPRCKAVVQRAEQLAREHGADYLGVEHLLLSIIDEDGSLAALALRRAECRGTVRDELLALMAATAPS